MTEQERAARKKAFEEVILALDVAINFTPSDNARSALTTVRASIQNWVNSENSS